MNMQHNTLKVVETENHNSCMPSKFESKSDDTGSDDDEN